jgi:hypothetical protein
MITRRLERGIDASALLFTTEEHLWESLSAREEN